MDESSGCHVFRRRRTSPGTLGTLDLERFLAVKSALMPSLGIRVFYPVIDNAQLVGRFLKTLMELSFLFFVSRHY
jgi:hypothetical protein